MKNTKIRLISALLSLVMLLSLCLCSCGNDESSSDLEYIQKKGKLIVGITDFEPMDYKNDKGEWIGFDADLAAAFASSIGVEVEFVEIDWDSKETELNNKTIDCVWNGMTLTDGVKEAMSTSIAYMDNAQVVVLKKDIASNYTTADSVKTLKFAVEAGSAGDEVITALGVTPTRLTAQSDALLEVASGTSDACVIDLLMALAMTGEGTSYPDLTWCVKLNSEQYGVGFRKGSDMAAKLNEFFKAASSVTVIDSIAKEYGVSDAVIKMN